MVNLAGLAVAVVASFIAKESGEALSLRVGYPTDHAELGENLVLIAALLFALTAVWYFFISSADYSKKSITKISGIVTATTFYGDGSRVTIPNTALKTVTIAITKFL